MGNRQLTARMLTQAVFYVRYDIYRFAVLSLAILTPCFWHLHIEAGDLGSHTYNVWLVQLIERGEISGLWINRQWTNVLFDVLLTSCIQLFSYSAGEKFAVAFIVLIFFWGAFALVTAATRRVSWYLSPLLATIAYGWTFQMGFFNYYISLGLAFFGLAIFWRGHGWERWLPLVLLPLIVAAHPLGAVWLLGAGVYIELAERLPLRAHVALFLAATAGVVFLHYYLRHRFAVWMQGQHSFYFFSGADQLVTHGARYQIPEFAAIVFCAICLLAAFSQCKNQSPDWTCFAISIELYALVEIGVFLLPEGIRLRHYSAAATLLTERATLISGVLICCALAALPAKRWHMLGWTAIASVFFTFLCQDTGKISQMEAQIEKLVRTLPQNQRVMGTIHVLPGSRVVAIECILDRACIGHCFSYGNYEPATAQFRVRAQPGNPYVLTDYHLVSSMQRGSYIVQPQDLPVYQVYQCSLRGTDLCIMPLEAGQENDNKGIHPGVP